MDGRCSRGRFSVRLFGFVFGSIVAVCVAAGSLAAESSPRNVDAALDGLEGALARDPGLAGETKAALQALVDALRAERSAAERAGEAALGSTAAGGVVARSTDRGEAAQRLSLYGDFRLRHESSLNLDDQRDRHRQRVRMRVGGEYALTDELAIGARIVTGDPDDPASPHQTLGNLFRNFDISLDRAFLRYQPRWLEGGTATLGKFAHPFFGNPVYSELVWDADVQPEGALLGYRREELGGLERLDLLIGGYTLLESSDIKDPYLLALQSSARFGLAEHLKGDLAVGYYFYSDVTPSGSSAILDANAGNATRDTNGDSRPDDFRSQFGILNPIAALSYDGWRLPLVLSGEYMLNTRARGGLDQGWAVGGAVGAAQRRGEWRAYYQWQVIEQDAVFALFAQDDFLFRTNHRSHLFGVRYRLLDPIQLHLWALVSERDRTFDVPGLESDRDQWRIRLDLDLRL